jgi:serine/threonine protein phosphatase PrpC
MTLETATAQIQGSRPYQEDAVRTERAGPCQIVVVCDGMGGHEGGDIASRTAADAALADLKAAAAQFVDAGAAEHHLSATLATVRRAMARAVKDGAPAEMGTTLIALIVHAHWAVWLSVGDSPLWRLTGDGVLERLNADHSLAPLIDAEVAAGELSKGEAHFDPRRHSLRSYVGALDEPELVDIAARHAPFEGGGVLIAATDGVETLPPAEIAACLAGADESAQARADALMDALAKQGEVDQDNATAAIVRAVG